MRRSRRLWAGVIVLLVAMQFGLLFHQSQHHLNPGILTGDDCALCQMVTGMGATPAAPLLVLPMFVLLEMVILCGLFAPRTATIALAFQPRAPPFAHSL